MFREERNYGYFLRLYTQHILPVADTFAYCLLRNHFHLLVKVKETASDSKTKHGGLSPISQGFANLFKAYTAAINKTYQRTGGLFERPFHRKYIANDAYFTRVIAYIHLNPQKHGFVKEFSEWPHSSYATLMSQNATRLQRDAVLTWFGGRERLTQAHALAKPDMWMSEQDFD